MKDTRKPGRPRKPGAGDRPERGARPFKKDGPRRDGPSKPRATGKPAAGAKPNPAHLTVTGEGERISKVMARAGVASRRDCERMIMEGRVVLNGRVLESPAVNVGAEDRIEVDGQVIGAIERTRLWIYYKPAGLVTTNFDPEGRPTVFENLPAELPRVISIGRLDINTEGLLLLTNDGGLARMLELPSTGWLRRYRVRAHGSIDQPRLDALREGIAVEGVLYGAIEATLDREQGHNVWITMGLREGKNREIKNVLGALGLDVNRLIRISYGPFQLGELEEGQVVEVKSRTLREQLGPRLIEDANANFEAPIHNQPKPEKEEDAGDWSARPRRESREERRERDLARIDTKKPERAFGKDRAEGRGRDRDDERGERRGGRDRDDRGHDERGRDDKKPKRPPLGTSRTANVWMAPGARPVAPKKAKAEETAEAKPKRRVLRLKTEGAETAEAPARKPRTERTERSERPARTERSGARPASRKPREERGSDERPARKPRPARSFEGERAPGGEERPKRPFSGKPRNAAGDGPRKGPGKGPAKGGGNKGPGRGADRRR